MRHVAEMPDRVVEEIDAGGLYACLTKYERYAGHEFKPYEGCAFGPDIEWGLELRQHGYRRTSKGTAARPIAAVCPRLCCVAEQNPGGVPARDPDRLIKWFVGVFVTGVGVNLLSGFVIEQKWAWLPPAVFVVALLVAVPRTGLLRRERHGSTRWARGLALLALFGYLAVALWGWMTRWPLPVMILSVAFLWGAGVLLMWSTLRSRAALDKVALGTACLLVGSAVLVGSGTGFWNAPTRYEVWGLLWAVVSLLVGVAFLLGGGAFLLLGTAFLLRKPRFGVAFLIGSFGVLVLGVASLLGGWRLGAVAVLLAGLAILLLGVAFLSRKPALVGVGVRLLGVALLLIGAFLLLKGSGLGGVGFLLLGVAGLLGRTAVTRRELTLGGVAVLLAGLAILLLGVALLVWDAMLLGVPFVLLGVAGLLAGVAMLYRPQLSARVVAWLTRRDDPPLMAGGDHRD
jgi:hypothetical protein